MKSTSKKKNSIKNIIVNNVLKNDTMITIVSVTSTLLIGFPAQ